MRNYRAVLVSTIATAVASVAPVYGADPIAAGSTGNAGAPQYSFRAAPSQYSLAPGIPRDGALKLETETASPAVRPGDYRYGLSSGSAGGSALNLSPSIAANRTGWRVSGRVGPMRWMTPLDGEGETMMRFGGRLPGQPRVPGSGILNVGIHYTFE